MKYKYIPEIIKVVEAFQFKMIPLTFYTGAESIRVKKLGGSEELAQALLASVIVPHISKEATHALWYIFLRDLRDNKDSDEEISATASIISRLASERMANVRFPFWNVIREASRLADKISDLLKRYKNQDHEVLSGIIARTIDTNLYEKTLEELLG